MSIAKQLVKVLPGEWFAYTDGDYSVWPTDGCAPEWEAIALCGEEESPWFINWALDELAKRGHNPDLKCDSENAEHGKSWFVLLYEKSEDDCYEPGKECSAHPTKTLALARALIALGENDG